MAEGEAVVHVVNMDIQDNQEEATIGAFLFHELMQLLEESSDLDNEIDEILQVDIIDIIFLFTFSNLLLQDFEVKCKRPLLHSLLFY